MNVVEEDEMVKLLDVKDIEIADKKEHFESEIIENDTETVEVTHNGSIGSNGSCVERRSDEPAELSFEKGDDTAIMHYLFICVEKLSLTHSIEACIESINNHEIA